MTKPLIHIPLDYQKPSAEALLQQSASFLELMKKRRTVRDFSSDPVPIEAIKNAISTAATAPSGGHKQPWHFVMVQDQELKKKIRMASEKEERQNYENRFSRPKDKSTEMLEAHFEKPFLEQAPVLIVIFKEAYHIKNQMRIKNYYVDESVGIATGFLIAALHYIGLVTLPHTPGSKRFLNEILSRPANETATLLLPVGYPADGAMVPDINRKSSGEILTLL